MRRGTFQHSLVDSERQQWKSDAVQRAKIQSVARTTGRSVAASTSRLASFKHSAPTEPGASRFRQLPQIFSPGDALDGAAGRPAPLVARHRAPSLFTRLVFSQLKHLARIPLRSMRSSWTRRFNERPIAWLVTFFHQVEAAPNLQSTLVFAYPTSAARSISLPVDAERRPLGGFDALHNSLSHEMFPFNFEMRARRKSLRIWHWHRLFRTERVQ